MRVLLKKEWAPNGTWGDRDYDQAYGYYLGAAAWEFDTVSLAVVYTPFPLYASYTVDQSTGEQPPEDYSKPLSELVFGVPGVEGAAATYTGYFHDGAAGVRTLVLRLTKLTTICFGASTGELQLLTSGSITGPFSYLWEDGSTTLQRGLVPAGRYSVTVTEDATGAACTIALQAEQNARINVLVERRDTQVTLVASGGTAPFTYLWSDGSTLATRTDLQDGTHVCAIVDALGCSAEVSVNFSRLSYYFSRNPIPLRLDAGDAYRADPTSLPELTFTCQVLVEQQYLSEEFTAVGTELEQPADRDGRTSFQVQELLAPYLDYHVPAPAGPVAERATALFKRFFLRHAQVAGNPPVKGPSTGAEQHYVLLGGLSFTEAQARTWFDDYQPRHKPFLTWEPNDKWVFAGQPEFLYFQALAPTPSVRMLAELRFDDNTSQVLPLGELEGVRQFEVFCFGVGFGQLNLARLPAERRDKVVSWQVSVVDDDGRRLSEVRRYHLDRLPPATCRYLLYANSLGGMNTFVARGEAQQDAEVTGDQVEVQLPLDYDPLRGDTAVLERELRPVLKLASGVHLGRAEHLGLQELLLSRRVLLLNAGRWLAGYVKTKTVNVLDEGKRVPTLEVEFVLPAERQFTPYLPPAAPAAVGPDSGAL
ncbi:SprB repeat-containing protein [Hymenobacter yonginensis]|uniref:SprB repeat-containing protein n=1 Tax=Hymenobacter yonginensis TaxID=748197 RepID=A0ABY7PTI2_9BACT|nr:SprB repeat-containing protein [Hymenobacter yonginensis]WBO86243.1 SprB repeat-containing protein [Hymenobacter yonginensis]